MRAEANRSHSVGANDVCCANNGWRGHARSLDADYRFPIDNCGKWESQLEELVTHIKTG
jgi:hypothetical protein